MTQVFKNPTSGPIEAVYNFPVDEDFTVVGMTAEIGEKVVQTEVMEKKEAREKYDDALAAGNTAVKMEENEDSPDILTLNIGMLLAGQEAKMTIRMVSRLEVVSKKFYSFKFPMEYIHKFGGDKVKKTGSKVPGEFGFRVSLKAASPFKDVSCSYKFDEKKEHEDGALFLTFNPKKGLEAKDVHLVYQTESISKP